MAAFTHSASLAQDLRRQQDLPFLSLFSLLLLRYYHVLCVIPSLSVFCSCLHLLNPLLRSVIVINCRKNVMPFFLLASI